MNITFTAITDIPDIYKPKPANNYIPEWYKNLESYTGFEKKPTGDGNTSATIKRCMPVFDILIAGYIIETFVDVYVSQKEQLNHQGETIKAPWYEWPSYVPIQFHNISQAPTHPQRNGHQFSYPKWINPWSIKTPKGYSTLFVQPFHRESAFSILPGIVDTDIYTAPVNFPFVLNDINFEGIIPAGTPIAQIIPIKRDNWQMEFGNEKTLQEQAKITMELRSKFFDAYKTKFRQKKEYK